MYGATLLFPNDKMPYEVAATTWTNLLGCPTYKGQATLDAIRAFGKADLGQIRRRAGRSVHLHRPDSGRTELAEAGATAPGRRGRSRRRRGRR